MSMSEDTKKLRGRKVIDAAIVLELLEEVQEMQELFVSEMGPISSPKRQLAEQRLKAIRAMIASIREDLEQPVKPSDPAGKE